ncbi:MAG: hypothetical protein KDB18_00940 [Salinibacterium sp.]|nr:hypothetical protein [Salinibacterium sp.]
MKMATRTPVMTVPLSERVLSVYAAYGTQLDSARSVSESSALAAEVRRVLRPGTIGLLSGPSGSGKSSTMRAVRDGLGERCIDTMWHLRRMLDRPVPVIDALEAPLEEAIRALCMAGLAEPRLWVRPPATLSDGERARLAIASCVLLAHRRPGSWMLIDECCALLDSITAHSVAMMLRRWVSIDSRATVLCASSSEDLADWLAPDRQWELSL